jgi:ketosteroid isomerase-like protein
MTEENKQLVRDFYEAGNRGDMDACLAILAEDLVWTNIGSTPFSGTYTGKQAVLEQLIGPLFSRLRAGIRSKIENLIAEGDVVVAETSGTAETLDGIAYNNAYCQIMTIRGGRIVRVKEYFDTELTSMVFGR